MINTFFLDIQYLHVFYSPQLWFYIVLFEKDDHYFVLICVDGGWRRKILGEAKGWQGYSLLWKKNKGSYSKLVCSSAWSFM